MDLRAVTLAKRFFRRHAAIERAYFLELFRVEFRCDIRRAHELIEDLIAHRYIQEREAHGGRLLSAGPNLDSGALAEAGVAVPPREG